MLTFTVAAETTATFSAEGFAAEAAAAAEATRCHHAEAQGFLVAARMAAADVPADWTSPGGASAADVVRLIELDAQRVRTDADDATHAARAAAARDDARKAAQDARQAEVCERDARYHVDSVTRLRGYLPHAAAECAQPGCINPVTDSDMADDNPDYCRDCNAAWWADFFASR